MKNKITLLYMINLGLILLFLIYICTMCKNEVINQRENRGYELITEYETRSIEDARAPLGVREEYILTLDSIEDNGSSLMFYSHHQGVEVYIGDELVLSLHASDKNPFGKTPGSHYFSVPVYFRDAGVPIRVVLTPAYESVKGTAPDFYYGSRFDVWMMLIGRNILPFFLSLAAVIIGMAFIGFTIYNYRNSEVDKSLAMMGFFAVGIGMWKIADMDCIGLMFPYSNGLTYLPYLALMMVVIPFALFVKELFLLKEHKIWYIICSLSLIYNIAALVLHITGVLDLRETLTVNHIVMLTLVLWVVVMLIYEWRKKRWSGKLKMMVICLSICLAGLTADIVMYYISDGVSMMVLGMCGFLVYIIVLGIYSLREMKELMKIGMEARHYEEMAYHDQLTGLYNRTAYAAFTGKQDFDPEQCIVVMCDLNNLKKCNDTCGHEKGDRYITESAKLIWRTFGDLGKCYRMGGDEFCVLLSNASLSECEQRAEKLKKAVKECNDKNPEEFPMQIACGYERYDSRLDYDLGDTLRRADKIMYREKFMMKQAQQLQQAPV